MPTGGGVPGSDARWRRSRATERLVEPTGVTDRLDPCAPGIVWRAGALAEA